MWHLQHGAIRSLTFVCVTWFGAIAHADDMQSLAPIERPILAPSSAEEAIAGLNGPRAHVISCDGSNDAFLIPIAGNAAGSGGTYFRSDVTFANTRSTAQRIGVSWLAQGVDNRTAPVDYYQLPANTFVALDDFVGETLRKTGLGAVIVIAIDSSGLPDSSAQIDAISRIWTRQSGGTGTVSQTFPAISLNDSIGSLVADVMGLKQNTQFRSNIGVVNLDTVPHTWTVRSAATGAITTVTVPPFSVVQAPLASGSALSSGNVSVTMKSDGFGFWWSAYGTSVDNITGDGWVSKAVQ